MNLNLDTSDFSAQRAKYYPSIKKQLDLLFHDIDAGKLGEPAKTSAFYTNLKAVKDKYPSG